MSSGGSVTHWIQQLKAGDESALMKVHQRYWSYLVGVARKRLGDARARRVTDEEDVAQEAFLGFYRSLKDGRLIRLNNREDLLSLLVVITVRKALHQVQREQRVKRGRGRVRGDSVVNPPQGSTLAAGGFDGLKGPWRAPDEQAILDDAYQRYLGDLPPALRGVAELLLAGYTHEQIAEMLACSRRTVERKLPLVLKRWEGLAVQEDAASSG